jgi:membrane protein
MSKIMSFLQFLRGGIWRIQRGELAPLHSFFLRIARIIMLSLVEFDRNRCFLRASALTYYTLLSIVPIVAMLFGVAKGFGLQELLERNIREKMSGLELVVSGRDDTGKSDENKKTNGAASTISTPSDTNESGSLVDRTAPTSGEDPSGLGASGVRLSDQIIKFANNTLEKTSGGLVAGIGVMILLWTIIKVLGNIEMSFNAIWGVKKSRSLARKFSDYLAFILLCPFILIAASSVTVMVTSRLETIVIGLALWGWVGDVAFALLRIIPLSLLFGLFTFAYIFMPNTKVKFSSGLLGGIVAGTLFQMLQIVYLRFQIGVTKYSAIYGSFAALPFFLIWLQTSWFIVLYGAELAFASQNVDTYEFEPDCGNVRPRLRRLVALAIARICVKRFEGTEPPATAEEIARALGTPIRLVKAVIFDLVNARVLSETFAGKSEQTAYQPARNTENLTIGDILDLLDKNGAGDIPVAPSAEIKAIEKALDQFEELRRKAELNARLREL